MAWLRSSHRHVQELELVVAQKKSDMDWSPAKVYSFEVSKQKPRTFPVHMTQRETVCATKSVLV